MSENASPPNVLKPRRWRPVREFASVPALLAAVACIFIDDRSTHHAVAIAALLYAIAAGIRLGVREAQSIVELILELGGTAVYWIAGGSTALLVCVSLYAWLGINFRFAEPVVIGACLGCAIAVRWPFVGRLTYEFFADIRHEPEPDAGWQTVG